MVKANWDTEELIENWTLLPSELNLVSSKVGANQIGFAVLLKYFQIHARFPDSPKEIPDKIISYIAQQLQTPPIPILITIGKDALSRTIVLPSVNYSDLGSLLLLMERRWLIG